MMAFWDDYTVSMKKRALLALIIMLPAVWLHFWAASKLFYSLSPSLGYKLFWTTPISQNDEIKPGDYVVFPAPVKEYNRLASMNLSESTKAMKQVKCISGQKLTVQGVNYYCDSVLLGTAKPTTLSGKPLSQFVYDGNIPEGKLFVMGTHRDSFDSRYLGFIDKNTVIATGTPLM